jgi:hypothetical protein
MHLSEILQALGHVDRIVVREHIGDDRRIVERVVLFEEAAALLRSVAEDRGESDGFVEPTIIRHGTVSIAWLGPTFVGAV